MERLCDVNTWWVVYCRAIRGLSNYMLFEAQRLSKEEVEEGKDKFDG